jgi:hypothetical protein
VAFSVGSGPGLRQHSTELRRVATPYCRKLALCLFPSSSVNPLAIIIEWFPGVMPMQPMISMIVNEKDDELSFRYVRRLS